MFEKIDATIENKKKALTTVIKERQSLEAWQGQIEEKAKDPMVSPYMRYKTDLNIADISGNTLLHYACMQGDLEAVKEYLSKGANVDLVSHDNGLAPIAIALQFGHLPIAKYLFENGALCDSIQLEECDPFCIDWLSEKLKEALHEAYPRAGQYGISKKNQFFHDNFPENSAVDLKYATQLGDQEYVLAILDGRKNFLTPLREKKLLDLVLKYAAKSGQMTLFEIALSKGASINPGNRITAPLHIAFENKQDNIIEYCLNNGANIFALDDDNKSVLYHAISSQNIKYIMTLLKSGANITSRTMTHGYTIIHIAAIQSDPQIMALLLEQKGAEALLQEKNIYGQTPLDLAIQYKNKAIIEILVPNHEQRQLIEDSCIYGHLSVPIDQSTIKRKISYFLQSQYRDPNFFSLLGHCNGFAYLYEYYCAKQMEDYYFNTLSLIASWDGTEDALNRPFINEPQTEHGYANLKAVLEQWINDIIWFQAGKETHPILQLTQWQRTEQGQLIGMGAEYEDITLYQSAILMNESELQEMAPYLWRMPEGWRFEFHLQWGNIMSMRKHATSAHRDKNGLIAYYDSNLPGVITRISDPNALVSLIMSYDAVEQIAIRIFLFKKDLSPTMQLFEPNESLRLTASKEGNESITAFLKQQLRNICSSSALAKQGMFKTVSSSDPEINYTSNFRAC